MGRILSADGYSVTVSLTVTVTVTLLTDIGNGQIMSAVVTNSIVKTNGKSWSGLWDTGPELSK